MRTVVVGMLKPQSLRCFVHLLQEEHHLWIILEVGCSANVGRLSNLSASECVRVGLLINSLLIRSLVGLGRCIFASGAITAAALLVVGVVCVDVGLNALEVLSFFFLLLRLLFSLLLLFFHFLLDLFGFSFEEATEVFRELVGSIVATGEHEAVH